MSLVILSTLRGPLRRGPARFPPPTARLSHSEPAVAPGFWEANRSFLGHVLFCLVPATFAVKSNVGDLGAVQGCSMQPTLNPQSASSFVDRILLDRWCIRQNEYRRGDVVVMRCVARLLLWLTHTPRRRVCSLTGAARQQFSVASPRLDRETNHRPVASRISSFAFCLSTQPRRAKLAY